MSPFLLESLNIVKSIKFLLTILVSLFSLICLNENLEGKILILSYSTDDFKMSTRDVMSEEYKEFHWMKFATSVEESRVTLARSGKGCES